MPVAGKESVVGDASSSAAAEAKVGTSRSAARAMRARRGTERRRRGIGAFLLRGYCPIGIGTPRLKLGKITAIQHPPLEVLTCEGIVRAPTFIRQPTRVARAECEVAQGASKVAAEYG